MHVDNYKNREQEKKDVKILANRYRGYRDDRIVIER